MSVLEPKSPVRVDNNVHQLCCVKKCVNDQYKDSHLCSFHRAEAIQMLTMGASRSPIQHLKRDMVTPFGMAWVYFVGCRASNLVKIGYTSKLKSRMSILRNSSPIPIKLFSVFLTYPEVERMIHDHFAASRKHGEWFEITDELNEVMKMLPKSRCPSFLSEDVFPSSDELVKRFYGYED